MNRWQSFDATLMRYGSQVLLAAPFQALRRASVAILCATVISVPTLARAWGAEGHRIIARLAEVQLTPAAKSEVDRLLSIEPGADLASISTWADETRSPSAAAWHYVNLPRDADCQYDAARDCPDGKCVVGAIERQRKVLMSSAPDAQRLKALKYLVHLVADIHQPLHAAYADDKGGNLYQVQAFGRGTNLHAIWDVALIEQWPGGPLALSSAVAAVAPASVPSGPTQWAEESCRTVAADGFYPAGHKIGIAYARDMAPVLKERLAAAGRRLAQLLNESLGAR